MIRSVNSNSADLVDGPGAAQVTEPEPPHSADGSEACPSCSVFLPLTPGAHLHHSTATRHLATLSPLWRADGAAHSQVQADSVHGDTLASLPAKPHCLLPAEAVCFLWCCSGKQFFEPLLTSGSCLKGQQLLSQPKARDLSVYAKGRCCLKAQDR